MLYIVYIYSIYIYYIYIIVKNSVVIGRNFHAPIDAKARVDRPHRTHVPVFSFPRKETRVACRGRGCPFLDHI